MMPIQALLPWIAFGLVALGAIVLHALPRRLSGPVTDSERRAGADAWIRAMLRRWVTPSLALVGLGLLLPPLAPPRLELRSLLVHVEHREPSGIECLVPSILERAARAVREHGVEPRRALREALLAAPLLDEDVACPSTFTFPPELGDADIESLELTLVMLATRTLGAREVAAVVRTTASDVDPWQLLAQSSSSWASISIDARPSIHGTGVVRAVDRAVVDGSNVELWLMLDGDAACDRGRGLELRFEGGQECELQWILPAACGSRQHPPVLAVDARCELPSPGLRVERARVEGMELSVDSAEPVRVQVEDNSARWTMARALATENRALVEELAARGLALPEMGEDADVMLRIDSDEIGIMGPRSCSSGPVSLPIADASPFSWSSVGVEDPVSSMGRNGIRLRVGFSALDPESSAYEPTIFAAAMYSIGWAASCIRHCTCTEQRPPPRGGETLPLLRLAEIDELVGRARRTRDAFGVLLIAASLVMTMLWIRSGHASSG